MATSKFTTCLWFDGQAEEAAKFYTSIFPNSQLGRTTYFLEAGREQHGREPGSVQFVLFELNGNPFLALNGGPHFKFSPATSHVVHCKDQEEVDYYWSKLGEGVDDTNSACGWLQDKFGISWQIVPEEMMQMELSEDSRRVGNMVTAMMKMKKLEMEPLRAAFNQEE